jgi:RNA polymerase sigma factor (TIGR02999 family)
MQAAPEIAHPDRLGYLGLIGKKSLKPTERLPRSSGSGAADRSSSGTVTLALHAWRDGDEQALDRLVPLVYDELRQLARRELRRERAGHGLQPTELVHDAYQRLVDLELSWQGRVHFYRMAARTMRRVLVDQARARRAEKRGGGAVLVTLDEARMGQAEPASDVLDLAEALERLAALDARLSQAVELFYFGGMTYPEIAEALEISPATVDRDLRFARSWLRRELAPAAKTGDADGA